MIEFLLGFRGANFAVVGDLLAFVEDGTMTPFEIEADLHFAVAIRERMPAYLFNA